MEITKEKYIEKTIRDYLNGNLSLEEYVGEHFELLNNPPLSFDELHEQTWVWDNKNEIYACIYETRINCANEQEIEFSFDVTDFAGNTFSCDIFEKNRFYRKEVKENERIKRNGL